MFEILLEHHQKCGHGKRDIMYAEMKDLYANITKNHIQALVDCCEQCQKNKVRPKKGIVVKPIITDEMNKRCQIDIIDLQAEPDGPFKYILNYQDHHTKFLVLKPLKTKCAEEVGDNLIDIFTMLGSPMILHSDNGR